FGGWVHQPPLVMVARIVCEREMRRVIDKSIFHEPRPEVGRLLLKSVAGPVSDVVWSCERMLQLIPDVLFSRGSWVIDRPHGLYLCSMALSPSPSVTGSRSRNLKPIVLDEAATAAPCC